MKLDAATVAAQFRKCGMRMPEPPAKKLPRQKIDGVYRSKLERDFAAHLRTLQRLGEIRRWRYEPRRWKLGGRRRITLDFAVWGWKGNRRRVLMETKGHYWERDRYRIAWFVDKYPAETLYIVTREKGTWCFKQVNE